MKTSLWIELMAAQASLLIKEIGYKLPLTRIPIDSITVLFWRFFNP
jgi:hypothetical protein